MKIEILDEAQQDLIEDFHFYESRKDGDAARPGCRDSLFPLILITLSNAERVDPPTNRRELDAQPAARHAVPPPLLPRQRPMEESPQNLPVGARRLQSRDTTRLDSDRESEAFSKKGF